MFSSQIRNALQADPYVSPYFAGVFPCDRLQQLDIRTTPFALVANTDPSYRNGEHWVAFHVDDKGRSEYFDSYGFPPLQEEFQDFALRTLQDVNKDSGEKVTFNNVQLQAIDSDVCGQYCIAYLAKRARGTSMPSIIKTYSGLRPGAKDKSMAEAVNRQYGIEKLQLSVGAGAGVGTVVEQCCCCANSSHNYISCVHACQY